MPSRNSVTCRPSRMTIASLPIRSMRLIWLSRLTRTHGQFSRTAPAALQTNRNTPPKSILPPESAPAYGLQIIVGLNDVPQLVLAGAIATVRVGMMTFHQNLEPRLDVGGAHARFQSEHIERLAFGIAHDAPLGSVALGLETRNARILEQS